MSYFDTISKDLKEYFNILSPEIPDFIYDYVEAPEMQRLKYISIAPGTDFTKLFNNKMFYSRLNHSIGVSLIIWNFTKDKKQALAGLFHDIANPAFSHCIDFLHGDYEKQESTEALTTDIIKNSEYIMSRLKRDGIKLEEVDDYKIYPIADNDTPRLSADRFEYSFSNGFSFKDIWKNEDIEPVYSNIEILKNEDEMPELGFKNVEVAEKFVDKIKVLWAGWINNEDRFEMQVIAEIVKLMVENNVISEEDLYKLGEKDVLEKAKECGIPRIRDAVINFENMTEVYTSDALPQNRYWVKVKGKRRYINPLVRVDERVCRLANISKKTHENISNFFEIDMSNYIYSNFEI
jgi:hypothetical protein